MGADLVPHLPTPQSHIMLEAQKKISRGGGIYTPTTGQSDKSVPFVLPCLESPHTAVYMADTRPSLDRVSL